MTLKKAYHYLFYKLYQFYEKGPSVWWSDWKAIVSMIALEIWFLLSLTGYYQIITKRNLFPAKYENLIGLIVIGILLSIKIYFFEYNDRWKHCITEFDAWPKRKNKIGGWLVFIVVLFVILNLIFMYYLMSTIEWANYR